MTGAAAHRDNAWWDVAGRAAVGSGWRGTAAAAQYLPARVIGRVPRHLDASEILLDMVTAGIIFRELIRGAGKKIT